MFVLEAWPRGGVIKTPWSSFVARAGEGLTPSVGAIYVRRRIGLVFGPRRLRSSG